MRSRSRALVAIAVACGAVAIASLAEASPYPDPPLRAPQEGEKPYLMRKHDGGCFLFYPSGGTVKIDQCPAQLMYEPVGEAISRDSSDACTYIAPYTAPGSSGTTSCPTEILAAASFAAAIPSAPPSPSFKSPLVDPPMGGLTMASAAATNDFGASTSSSTKDRDDRKSSKDDDDGKKGCSGCATTHAPIDGASFGFVAAAIAIALRRRAR